MKEIKKTSMQTKICKHCGQELPITEFGINNSKDAKDGLQSWCHSCMAEYNRLKSVHRDTGVKVCRKCWAIKPRSEFNANKKHKDGLQSYCKECDREHGRLKNGYTGEYREPSKSTQQIIDVVKEGIEALRDRGFEVNVEIKTIITL